MRGGFGESDGYNVTRQIILGDIEAYRPESCLIVHYSIQVDVFDDNFEPLGDRSEEKVKQIVLKNLSKDVDVESLADKIISHYEIIPENRRSHLIRAINELIDQPNARPQSTKDGRTQSPDDIGPRQGSAVRSSSANSLASMTKDEVDDILRDALQKIHWGKEKECLETLTALVEISQLDRNLTLIIQHDPLMNTLINGLKKFAATSLPACIKIMTIFERMSFLQDYIDLLSRFKIGAMSLSLLHAQIALSNVAIQNLEKEKLAAYLKSQNQLMKLIVSLLFNLSENPSTMRKMVNKDIVTGLVALLERRNVDLLILVLRFIRKIAMVPVNWSDIPYDAIIPAIVQNIFRWSQDMKTKQINVLKEGLELLYTFSFHPETVDDFKSAGVFSGLSKMVTIKELRSQMIRMFYKCSTSDGSYEAFRNEHLLNMLIEATTSECEERLIALVVLMKLSLDKECAQTIAKSPVFTTANLKNMFVQATTSQNSEGKVLLKMIRNVADSQPDLVKGFDEEIIKACAVNSNKQESLVEIFAVANRAKMNSERAKYFAGQKTFVQLLINILSSESVIPQLHLECVMFVSSLVLYSAPAQVLEKLKVVDHIVHVFLWHNDELDIQTQCLFSFYRFICHSGTRNSLISHPEIVDAVIQHSASKNAVLNQIANAVLDALVTFDKKYADRIKVPRFDAFNQEWLQVVSSLNK